MQLSFKLPFQTIQTTSHSTLFLLPLAVFGCPSHVCGAQTRSLASRGQARVTSNHLSWSICLHARIFMSLILAVPLALHLPSSLLACSSHTLSTCLALALLLPSPLPLPLPCACLTLALAPALCLPRPCPCPCPVLASPLPLPP
jgi:hypothetical protein